MLLACASAVLAMANPTSANVGHVPLIEGRDEAAIEELMANNDLADNDPVKLINLGIAYARQGRSKEARAMFEAAMRSSDRAVLETAEGQWVESRHLARLALQMLERGELRADRMAAR